MPRRTLQAALGDYAEKIQTDHGWTATREEHAAALGRLVDDYIVATDTWRELAAVRAAADRQRQAYEFQIAALTARLAEKEEVRVA